MALLRDLPAWQSAKVEPKSFQNSPNTVLYCADRCAHCAVAVRNELLIWGGYHDRAHGSEYCEKTILWSYHLDHDIWFGVETTGSVPQYRSGAASSLLWPHWYIIAGHTYQGDTNDLYRLNLLTLQWENLSQGEEDSEKLSPRDKASAWTYENRIYCFGGYGVKPFSFLWGRGDDSYTFELETDLGWNDQVVYFDKDLMKWVRPPCAGPKPSGRAAHSSVCVRGIVYLFGGRHGNKRLNDLHCFKLEIHTWSGEIQCKGRLPEGRSWHAMSQVGEDTLVLFGGFNTAEMELDDVWLLNIESFSWSQMRQQTGFPRLWHTSCTTVAGDTLVYGGCENNILKNQVLITSSTVILLRTSPFALERLCLHAAYRHKALLEDQWSSLPKCHQHWLQRKAQAMDNHKPPSILPNVVRGLGPDPSQLVLIQEKKDKPPPTGVGVFRSFLQFLYHAFD